jgi:Leucine-rich repeat (LRR) protein
LESFRFAANDNLSGTIPTKLCDLTNLRSLVLNHNALSGEIPSCLGELSVLGELVLSSNLLEGSVPMELTSLAESLKYLYLDDNMFTDDPTGIVTELKLLLILFLNDNDFMATLESTFLSEVTNLTWVDLSNNQFEGSFPSHLFQKPKLNVLDLSKNQLTGDFTNAIEENTNLQLLAVYENKMTGSWSNLVNLIALLHLDLSDNRFTGSMDPIMKLQSLSYLFLSENPTLNEEPIPNLISSKNLTELSLRNTNRIGELPDSIGKNLTRLKLLDLGSNNLEGAIPASYGELSRLQFLLLNNNTNITGDLPTTFSNNMTQLLGIFLDGTNVNGTAAVELLCELPNFNNNITGVEVVIVDGQGNCTTCTGCQFCDPSTESGCSEPLLGNLDVTWTSRFVRQPYDFDLRNDTGDGRF